MERTIDPVKSGWIKCSKRMPENHVDVLVYSKGGCMSMAWHSESMHRYYITDSDYSYDEDVITHWMPLPEPPKEDESNVGTHNI